MNNKIKKIAIWMYVNDNGHIPRETLSGKLKQAGFEVFSDFDMRDCYVINGQVYTSCGTNLSDFDLIYHMNADKENNFQLDILKAIEDSGVKVINDSVSLIGCKDKFFANMHLRKNGIMVPESALFGKNISKEVIYSIFNKWDKVVFKSRIGHGATGVVKFDNSEQFLDFFHATKSYLDDYYLEQYIDFDESDLRVEIFDGKVLGGYSRHKNHSFKTNISSGGKMMPRKMGAEEEVAKNAAKALGITGTIVDMVESKIDGEIYVLEVNHLLGIFVETAMKAETKMPYTEPHEGYCYDNKKIEAIVEYAVNSIK